MGNQYLYPDIYLKAASLFEGLIRFHPFVDGNKRTALASLLEYLLENGILFMIPIIAVRFAVKVAQRTGIEQDDIDTPVNNISYWIKFRSAEFTKLTKIWKAITLEGRLFKKIRRLSNKRKKPEILNQVIDYRLAKDVYPDSDITFDEMSKFQDERFAKFRNFLRSR